MYWLVGLKNFRRNKNRTANVVIILALLIASSVTLFVGSASIQDQVNLLEKSVGTVIEVRPVNSPMGAILPNSPLIPAQSVEDIQKIPGVVKVSPYLRVLVNVPKSAAGVITITGITSGQEIRPTTMGADVSVVKPVSGQLELTRAQMNSNDAIVGLAFAEALGVPTSLSSPTGMGSMSGVTAMGFKIQGVIDRTNIPVDLTFNHVGVYSSGTILGDYQIFAPLPMVQAIYNKYLKLSPIFSQIYVTVDSVSRVSSIVDALRSLFGEQADVVPPQVSSSFIGNTLKAVSSNGVLQGQISMGLGAMITALTMALTTVERRKEIGVMKAIGASNRQVMLQLSVEGLAMSLLGGLLGLLIFFAAGQRLGEILLGSTALQYVAVSLSPALLLTVVGYSVGASALFAAVGILYPVYKVTRIDPTEAMRHE